MFSIHQGVEEIHLFIKDDVNNLVPFIVFSSRWDVGETQDKGQIRGKVEDIVLEFNMEVK